MTQEKKTNLSVLLPNIWYKCDFSVKSKLLLEVKVELSTHDLYFEVNQKLIHLTMKEKYSVNSITYGSFSAPEARELLNDLLFTGSSHLLPKSFDDLDLTKSQVNNLTIALSMAVSAAELT